MPKRIAVLFHAAHERFAARLDYGICRLAEHWRDAGHDVRFVFGTRSFVPADLAVLHVDLSVVPPAYLELARRYPRALNAQVADVRKSTFSTQIVGPGEGYDGPVIVKSDLNFGGLPERLLTERIPPAERALNLMRTLPRMLRGRRPSRYQASSRYRVYRHLHDVPPACFADPALVVERFIPEVEDGKYWVRVLHVLGDRATAARIGSHDPIVKAGSGSMRQDIPIDPQVLELRRRLRLDYGKLDYVVHDGRAILLDVNKTPGESRRPSSGSAARLRLRAAGIESYWADVPSRADTPVA